MAEIREKMLAADVIVLASPIYFYTMTAQMEAGDIRQTDAPEQAYRVICTQFSGHWIKIE